MNPTLSTSLPDDIQLLETLGSGTFGTVYVARVHDGALSRTVVLKVLKQDWSKEPEALRRARDEAAMLSRLNHDNIVRVERLTTWRGHVTVVMEHLVGLSLDQVLRHHGPLPVWSALEITSRVCSALDAAYAGVPPGEAKPLRIVHRDIKPSNILLTVSGAVKVLDFGAARAEFDAREAATRSMAFGTLLYMAPECFDAGPPGPPVDVYALGATLVELLSGEPLGKLSVSPQRFWPALQARLARMSLVDLPEGPGRDAVLELISRTLRYDPDRRPDAQTLRASLRELMNKQPIPRFGLDQLGETVVDPLYRRREVLPATPPDGTLFVPAGVLDAKPPETTKAAPPFADDATIALRRDEAPIISRRLSAPVAPTHLGRLPQSHAASPLTVTAGLAPPPIRVLPKRRTTSPEHQPTDTLEELELDDEPSGERTKPRSRRFIWVMLLAVIGAGLGVGGMIALALSVGDGGEELPVEPPAVVSQPTEVVEGATAGDLAQPNAPAEQAPETAPTAQGVSKRDKTKEDTPPVSTVVKPPPPPKAPAPTGKLRVGSLPADAEASVKGHDPCSTPCTLTLPQGAHKVNITFRSSSAGPELSGSCQVQLAEAGTLKVKRGDDVVLCE
jgi:serine/threonine protein kinase